MSTAVCFRVRAPSVLLASLLITMQVAAAAPGAASVVSVPLSLEYPLLRHLLVTQLFHPQDESREILNDPRECNRIVLSEPRIGAQGDNLEILAKVKARLGVEVFGDCLDLMNWRGGAAFLGKPVMQPDGTSITLEPQKTWLIADDGSKIFSGRLWDAGNARLMSFFGSFVLDLAPQLESLGTFVADLLPNRSTQQLQATIGSLTLGKMQINPKSLDFSIELEVAAPTATAPGATELSAGELAQFEARWQMMDALMVAAVKHYAAATPLTALRSQLLEILIDSRYRLRDILTAPPSRDNDAVRGWFIDSWHSLTPVVRAIAEQYQGQEHMLWFSAVTAADALYALNQVGSTIGLEISTQGLRRLARMINAAQVDDMLRYSEEVDPELQRLLREDIEAAEPDVSALRMTFSLFPNAYAEAPGDSLKQWLPVKGKLKSDYLPKVESLLEKTADSTLQQHKLEPGHRNVFAKLVLATAWQESCWRQYVVLDKRIEPLRSSSGDLGLMQVNERVWRGFYDLQKLRWDINYNSRAGTEILLEYLVKYALKRGEQKQPGGLANLARASYSAYNGGPSQVARYRSATVAPALKKVDSLFWEKYRQVDAGQALNVARCLGEDLDGARG